MNVEATLAKMAEFVQMKSTVIRAPAQLDTQGNNAKQVSCYELHDENTCACF